MNVPTIHRSDLKPAKILVVDDTEANRLLLQETLELDGHEVLTACNGTEALSVTRNDRPDVVLLDVNMPGMNGLEVCRQLKGDPITAAIPVILVTALVDRESRLRGIASGANEYLTKPIDRAEVLLRVGNAVRLHRLHLTAVEQYRQLQELEGLRDSLVHMVVHDLRGPLTGMNLGLEFIRERFEESFDRLLVEDIEAVIRCAESLSGMVDDVLDVSRIESQAMPLSRSSVDLCELAGEALALLGQPSTVAVTIEAGPECRPASVDRDLIKRVIANLVFNALKFAPTGSPVRVEVSSGDDGAMVRVVDVGPGIPLALHGQIFDKFGQVKGSSNSRVRSSGLGLAFCKLAVESHGGRIGVESTEGEGTTFWVALPAA